VVDGIESSQQIEETEIWNYVCAYSIRAVSGLQWIYSDGWSPVTAGV